MMNTLVQSMRSAKKKKIKPNNNTSKFASPCWPVYCTVYLFLLSFVYFPFSLAASNEIDAPLILATWDHLIVHKTPTAHRKNEQHAKRTSKQNEYFCPHCSQKCNKFSRIWSEIRYNFHFFSCVLRPFLALRLLTFFVYFFASLLV